VTASEQASSGSSQSSTVSSAATKQSSKKPLLNSEWVIWRHVEQRTEELR
jgi:hypothetical protein